MRVDGTDPNVGGLDGTDPVYMDPHLSRTSWGASAIEPLNPL